MQLRAAISWQRMKGLSPLTKLQPKKGNWSSKMPKESTKWRPAICIGKTFPSNRHGTGSLWVLKKHGQQPRFRKACVGLLFSWRRGFFPCLENVFFFITCRQAPSCKDPREAKVFICGETISDKVYLLAAACGGCIISKSLAEGKSGFKLRYQERKFAELTTTHLGIHCSERFRLQHQGFMQVLSFVVEKH